MRKAELGAFWLLILTLALSGCNYRHDKGMGEDRLANATWFQRIRMGVLEPHCLRCHMGMNAAHGIDFSDYAKTMASGAVVPFKPNQSAILDSIKARRMPKDRPGSVPDDAIDKLTKWIVAGAPEKDLAAPPPFDPPQPKFSWLNEHIFKVRCLGCHKPPEAQNTVDFTSYETLLNSYGMVFKAVDEGSPDTSGVYDQTKTKQMPPLDLEKLTDAETKAIADWIAAGARNN